MKLVLALTYVSAGQTITWVKERNSHGDLQHYHPVLNQEQPKPETFCCGKVASLLSSKAVANMADVLVDIPQIVKSKNISLALDGYEVILDKPQPLWMMFDGSIWQNPSISQHDVREIYTSFFEHQVVKAIQDENLPFPQAMVFSGGQQEHFCIAEMLSGILGKYGIQSLPGFKGGSHCGVARRSYPDSRVLCDFTIISCKQAGDT